MMVFVLIASRKRACFCAGQDRCLAALRAVRRPAHRSRRIHAQDAGDDQVVAEHPDRGQVLLHGGRGGRVAFDVGGDDHRLQLGSPHETEDKAR
jgi:hypothetical protein